jgi:hypothetical protein
MFAKKMFILAVGFGAVTAVAVRPYASDGPWWRLLGQAGVGRSGRRPTCRQPAPHVRNPGRAGHPHRQPEAAPTGLAR